MKLEFSSIEDSVTLLFRAEPPLLCLRWLLSGWPEGAWGWAGVSLSAAGTSSDGPCGSAHLSSGALGGVAGVVKETRRLHRDGSFLEPTAWRAAWLVRVGELGAGRGRWAPAEVLPCPPSPRGSRALAHPCGAQGGRSPRPRTLAGGDCHTSDGQDPEDF